jgi:predicted transposase YdaD
MDVLLQSPWYQEILQKGVEQGRLEGRLEGRQEGEAEILLRQLTRRFGALDAATRQQVCHLPPPQLEALGEALLDFKERDEFEAWLAKLSRVEANYQDGGSTE